MPSTRIPSPTKRGAQRPPSAGGDDISSTPRTRPRRPSVKDILHGVVAPQQRPQPSPRAAPPSSFKVPPKPEQPSKPRSSSLGRTSSTSSPLQRSSSSRSGSPTKHAAASAGKQPTRLARSSSQSRPSPAPLATRRPSNSSGSAAAMQQPASHATPSRGHARSSSLQEQSARHVQNKPAFSTFQQQFTPAKKLPTSAAASQQRAASSVSSASSPRGTPAPVRTRALTSDAPSPKPPAQSLDQLRAQTHLLHMSLLHRDFQPTYQAWAGSAHDKLAARFAGLRTNYSSSLTLARSVRQARNILALHRWSNGNSATLTRKLASLAEIMRQVCDLTLPPPHDADGEEDCGEFLRLARQFDAWSTFVQSVWSARDFFAPRPASSGSDDSPPWTPSAADFAPARRGRRLSRDERAAAAAEAEADEQALDALAAAPIPGLGDSFKASLRTVGAHVDRLHARLDELRDPAIPLVAAHGLSQPRSPGDRESRRTSTNAAAADELAAHADAAVAAIPTPRYVADMLAALVAGMRDEVQIMREAEFEVAIGERAWAESRVRGAARDVLGGWGTPRAATDVRGQHNDNGTAPSPWGPPPLAATLAGGF